ncbi:MAG: hypothetical protein HOC52_02255 [Thiotrichales bacterium]|nr:hypothetical protein [Thiotrichales bacterium]
MPKNFSRKIYDSWIGANIGRFRFPPRIVESRKQFFILQFDGIAPELSLTVHNDGQAIIFIHDRRGEYWDMITDFDVHEQRLPNGQYICLQCDNPRMYPSRTALWEDHTFEEMLVWINELTSNQYICLYGIPYETTWGAIKLEKEDVEKKENQLNCFQIVVKKTKD